MIFAIFDLYNKLKKCQDKLEEHDGLLLDLKGIVNSLKDYNLNRTDELIEIKESIEYIEEAIRYLHKLRKTMVNVQHQLVDRVDDLERSYACLADSQESLDDSMVDLEKYHDELVDFVMEVREDVQYCKAKMKSQKRYCKKCRKSSGIDCESIWREIDGLKLRLEGYNAENTRSANG